MWWRKWTEKGFQLIFGRAQKNSLRLRETFGEGVEGKRNNHETK